MAAKPGGVGRSILTPFLPHLSEALTSVPNRARLERAAATLPPFSGAFLEIHIGHGRTDLSVRVQATEKEALIDRPPLAGPAWGPIHSFFNAWQAARGPLAMGIENVYLEFDLAADSPAVPSIFLDVDRHGVFEAAAKWRIIATALDALGQQGGAAHRLRPIVSQLGDEATYYIGVMLSRPTDALRLCIRDLRREAIPPLLAQIDWPGEPAVLDDMLGLAGDAERLYANVDVGETVQPGIGLDLRLQRGNRAGWDALLHGLERRGLCSRSERAALMAWPAIETLDGRSRPDLTHLEAWRGRPLRRLIRTINHFKLSGEKGEIRAKAYLFAGYT